MTILSITAIANGAARRRAINNAMLAGTCVPLPKMSLITFQGVIFTSGVMFGFIERPVPPARRSKHGGRQ